jgi:hypothetical protein
MEIIRWLRQRRLFSMLWCQLRSGRRTKINKAV